MKKQAILLPSGNDANLIEHVVGLGRIIEPSNIISASKISKNCICIYLNSEKTVNAFMDSGGKITINNKLIQTRKLVAPSKRHLLQRSILYIEYIDTPSPACEEHQNNFRYSLPSHRHNCFIDPKRRIGSLQTQH